MKETMFRRFFRSARPSAVLIRMATALAVAGAFLWTASEIDPGASLATQSPNGAPKFAEQGDRRSTSDPSVDNPAELEDLAARLSLRTSAGSQNESLVSLIGKEHAIHIQATPKGPRFTVTDRAGAALAEDLTAKEVYKRFPDLWSEKMIAGPLMMADPVHNE